MNASRAGEKCHLVVVKTQNMKHPRRLKAKRLKAQDKHPLKVKVERRFYLPDQGGEGTQVKKELALCSSCFDSQ